MLTGAAAISSAAWIELLHAEVAWVLSERGVDALLIKGLTTSRWLGLSVARVSADVDVLVAPTSVGAARAALAARGFEHVHAGTRHDEPAQHSLVLRRTDTELGLHEVDLHVQLPGSDADPRAAWDAVWARAVADQVAGVPVWFPDLPTRALLVANQAARDGAPSPRSASDLAAALRATPRGTWAEVVSLARETGLVESLSAGLGTLPEGRALASRLMPDAEVSDYWRLRAAGAHRTATRLVALREMGWGARVTTLPRILVPSGAMIRLRDPQLVARGRGGLAAAYLRRLGQGLASLPRALREVRGLRR